MKKSKRYLDTRFTAEALKEAIAATREVAARTKADLTTPLLNVDHDDSTWNHDSIEEFLADYRKYRRGALVSLYGGGVDLTISFDGRDTTRQREGASTQGH